MNELKRIITTEKKIREITHELRDWLTINKERIHLLFEYISNILKEKDNEKLSFDYIFILFCCSGDSISRSNNIYLKEDNWERLLKILLIKIKLYSKIIQIEKYESTLIKVLYFIYLTKLTYFILIILLIIIIVLLVYTILSIKRNINIKEKKKT